MITSTTVAPAAPDYRALVLSRVDQALPPVIRTGLADTIAQLLDASMLADRLDALVNLVDWIREGGDPETDLFAPRGPNRLELVRSAVAADPDLGPKFHRAVAAILDEVAAENLFAEAGIPSRRGFVGELVDRTLAYVLPTPRDDHELSKLLLRLFSREREVDQFIGLSSRRFDAIASLFFPDLQSDSQGFEAAFADGFRLLAARAQAEALNEQLRTRTARIPVADSPFIRLSRVTDDVLEAWRSDRRGDMELAALAWRAERAACRAQMAEVQRRLDTEGVSIDIVEALEVIDRCLSRMSLMLEVMEASSREMRDAAIHRLAGHLIVSAREDRSIGHLMLDSLRLLGRRMVDRAGAAVEPYVAYSRQQYRMLLMGAAGGGLVVAALAAVKLTIQSAGLAPFQSGLLVGIACAIGFLVLQASNFVLAVRQPAAASATLAAIFRERRGTDRIDEIVDVTARVCHSQVAATLGNVVGAVAGGVAFELSWRFLSGGSFLSPPAAFAVQFSLGPWSGTLLYATVTGVILWLASLVGGWFDNWSSLRRLPLAIRDHPIGKHVGRHRMARLAGVWTRNAAGIGTSVSLGLMLGLAPTLGSYFGLPLDVRHVSLAAGELVLATASLWPDGMGFWLLNAGLGLACTFALNLGVSFALAFLNAARAYELPLAERAELARRLLLRISQHPTEFVLPSRTPLKLPVDATDHAHA